jgi:site-specific DNA-cytosine methylase
LFPLALNSLNQAGEFGAPQTRKRIFLMAARADVTLPAIPYPTHALPKQFRKTILEEDGGGNKIALLKSESGVAAYQHTSIWDAIGDLHPFDWCVFHPSLACEIFMLSPL